MRRGVAGICVACTLLISAAPPSAIAQEPPAPAVDEATRRLCDGEAPRHAPLTDDQAAACRKLWLDDVAAAKARSQAYRQAALEAFKARKERPRIGGPVPLENFVGEDTLVFGDIVVTDAGRASISARPTSPPASKTS